MRVTTTTGCPTIRSKPQLPPLNKFCLITRNISDIFLGFSRKFYKFLERDFLKNSRIFSATLIELRILHPALENRSWESYLSALIWRVSYTEPRPRVLDGNKATQSQQFGSRFSKYFINLNLAMSGESMLRFFDVWHCWYGWYGLLYHPSDESSTVTS